MHYNYYFLYIFCVLNSFADLFFSYCFASSLRLIVLFVLSLSYSAGSVVQHDPTERLNLMSGQYSPVKTRGVVPHDIGDPGEWCIIGYHEVTRHICQREFT